MMRYKCHKCGYEDSIEYGVAGYCLIDAEINFKCIKCDSKMTLFITFPNDKKSKKVETLEYDEADYIG